MRNAFAKAMEEITASQDDVVLLSGDIGNRMFDKLKEQTHRQFIVHRYCKQTMIGTAAGLAMSGLRPVVYTIAPFTTYRCFEQIRVDICYNKAPVIIVGTGAGLSYASLLDRPIIPWKTSLFSGPCRNDRARIVLRGRPRLLKR